MITLISLLLVASIGSSALQLQDHNLEKTHHTSPRKKQCYIPATGTYLRQEFLSSLRGMGQATSKALEVFRKNGVEPIVESKAGSLRVSEDWWQFAVVNI